MSDPISLYTVAPRTPSAQLVTFDGLPLIVTDDPHKFLHAWQGQSVHYALTHGGYAIRAANDGIVPVLTDGDLRGAAAYLTLARRRGYGIQGFAVRLIGQLHELVNTADAFPDYVLTSDVVAPLATACIGALAYLDGELANIRGMLDSAIRKLAIRGGLTPTEADQL